jgi:hypothetical protein
MKNSIFIFLFIFTFVSSCVNPGVTIKDSPSLKQSGKDLCEYKLYFTDNIAKEIVSCKSGYKFILPKLGIDEDSCWIQTYTISVGQTYVKKHSLICKDFNNEKNITIY